MTFRNTGKKDSGNTISRDSAYLSANDGLLIPACSADKSIVIYDVLSYGSGKLGTAVDGGGTQLCFINAGQNHFGISAIVPAGQGVYTNAQSGSITVTYAIVDGLPASLITNIASGGGGATTTTAAPTNLKFALGVSSVAEGNAGTSTHTVTVDRIGNTSGTATVYYETVPVSAEQAVDYIYTSGTLTFTAGVTSQTISITIAGDTGNEDDETFMISLSNPTQTVGVASITGTNPHVVTITNDDTSNIGFLLATSAIAEGAAGHIAIITVTRSDTHGTASVDYATADGTAIAGADYTGISTTTLSFADGVGMMDISVAITGDTVNENDETFTVTLTNAISQYGVAVLGTSVHTVTITNDDTSTVGFALATSSVAEGDSGTSTHTIAVTRSDTNGTASVDYATADGTAEAGTDYSSTTGSLSFADGVGSVDISVVISGDTDNENDETFTVVLANAGSQYGAATLGTSTHTVTITNDDTAATTTTTTTTTTGAPGNYLRVEDCNASSVYYIIDDSMLYGPSVGDVVFWSHTNMNMYCSTVIATDVGGTSVGDIMGVDNYNMDPYSCGDCTSENSL